MIVKTGANYQAEGGYIEFAADNSNGVTIINGQAVPTQLYKTATEIFGIMSVSVRKTTESDDGVRIIRYRELTSLEGVKYFDYAYFDVTTTASDITIPSGFGVFIGVPSGMKPVLANGSNDVQIIRSASAYLLFITGENPVAVLSYTEA